MTTQTIRYNDAAQRCFIDTEFYEDGKTIDLIAIGIVCSDGREYYAVNVWAHFERVSPWVRENVLVHLPEPGDKAWKTRAQIAKDVREFVTDDGVKNEFWAYFADYDHVALCQLFGTMMDLPKHFPMFCMDLKQLAVMLGNPALPTQTSVEHHALHDARHDRDVYDFLRNQP